MTKEFDAVIVGSGINALVCGAMLAKNSWRVAILERNDRPGGAISTRTDVFPGFTVELLSSWHPLFLGGPAYAELAGDLARLGVEYLNTEDPTGVVCADGSAVLSTDAQRSCPISATKLSWHLVYSELIFGDPTRASSAGKHGVSWDAGGSWKVVLNS
jgi:phytoene dehydrogenase-like protein